MLKHTWTISGGSFIGTPVDPNIKDAAIAANNPFTIEDTDCSAMHKSNATKTKEAETINTEAGLIPNLSRYFILWY